MADEQDSSISKRGIITIIAVFGGMFLIFFLFAAVVLSMTGEGGFGFGGPKIGVVEIVGPIMTSKSTLEDFRRFEKDESVKGIVVRIDSPGGAVAPSQELFQAVKRVKKKKPLAVTMGNTAASGGYYIAVGSDQIFANRGSVTGSIGVITQLFNVEPLLDEVPVEVNTVKTGPYKDSGSPFKEFDVQDRMYFEQLINDVYDQFVEDVAEARDMTVDEVKKVADGRVFTGRQARELGLVDELGTFHDAVEWVKSEAEIEGDASLVYPPKEGVGFLGEILQGGVRSLVSEAKSQSTPIIEYRYTGPQ